MSPSIVATARTGNNEPVEAAVRVRLESSAVAWQQRRLVLGAGAIVAAASHFFGSPVVAAIAIYGLAAAVAIGEAEVALARRSRTQRQFDVITLVARVALVTVLALALTLGGASTWVTLAVLAGLVISISGSVSTISTAVVVAYTSLLFVLAEEVAISNLAARPDLVSTHRDGHMSTLQVLGVAFIGLPGLAAVVHLRWRSSVATRQQLEATVDELSVARSALEESRTELEHLNQDLSAEVSRQTSELEQRNRYLSVVNAVSTALAEPGNSEPLVGRATRIAARLLGAQAAQGWQSATVTEAPAAFVRLDGEDDAMVDELPLELMQQVANGREPLLSGDAVAPDGEPLPDVGGPFAIVPIRSRGESLGAFALFGLDGREIGSRERNLLLSVGREIGAALLNAQHLHETEERADHVAFLSQVARLAAGRQDTGEALNAALEAVREHLGALRVAVITAGAEGRRETLASAGPTPDYSRDGRYASQLSSEVAGGRSAILRRGDGLLPHEVAEDVGTLIIAPITAEVPGVAALSEAIAGDEEAQGAERNSDFERVVGVLVCSSAREGVWGDETVELLEELAEIVARRLESDAFERLRDRRIEELGSLAEVARLMQSGADVERLCGGFAQALRTLLPYRGMTIVRASTMGSSAQVHHYDSGGRARRQVVRRSDHSLPSLLEPATWPSEGGDAVAELLAVPSPLGVALPMMSKGQSLGEVVIGLEAQPDRELLAIVEQAVEQLALALDSATLYQQATSRASQIQTQSNLARIVASQPDLRRAFDEFAEEMRWLVPFDRAVLFLVDEADPGQLLHYATAPAVDRPHATGALDEAIVEICAQHDQPFLLTREAVPSLTDDDWLTLGGDAREAVIVPVRNQQLIALFVLLSDSERRTVPVDIDVLSEVANLLAVTIERVRLFERAEHMARHDQLTGLPNFRYVQEHLAAIAARPDDREITLLMLDMDNLKPFNDLLGHEVGDRVIRVVAQELLARSRSGDFVGRLGGDEFVMVMENVGAEEAIAVANRVHAALRDAHLEIENAPEPISVSVGVATCPTDAGTVGELLQAADRAMYAAKALGGGRTALARDSAPLGAAPQAVGRTGRLTDVLLRSSTGNATESERTAVTLADRYARLAAEQLDLDVSVHPALRVLVIAAAVGRFEDSGYLPEVPVARALLRAVDASMLVDHTVAKQVQAIADGAVELAWVQTPGLTTSPVSDEEALRRLDRLLSRPDTNTAGRALASIVRSDAAERRSGERVA